MKKVFISVLLLCGLISCEKDNLKESTQIENQSNSSTSFYNDVTKDFSIYLAKAAENKNFRKILKEKALEKSDGDYDILYHVLKSESLNSDSHQTIEDLILSNAKDPEAFKIALENYPLLTIFIPKLIKFSPEEWDTENDESPLVVMELDDDNNHFFDGKGHNQIIASSHMPAFPVLVVKKNERFKLKTRTNLGGIKNSGSKRLTTDHFEYELESESYINQSKELKTNAKTININSVDPVIQRAYHIAKDCGGCTQRDYIYYKIDSPGATGSFDNRYTEAITDIRFLNESGLRNVSSNWVEGDLELHLTAFFVGGDDQLGNIKKVVTVATNDLYNIITEKRCYRYILLGERCFDIPVSREMKPYVFPTPVEFDGWDMQLYGDRWRINMIEFDPSTTYERTISHSTTKGTNYKVEGSGTIKKVLKLGAEFGGSKQETKSSSLKTTYTTESDELGDIIINWRSPVINNIRTRRVGISRKERTYAYTYTANTGTVVISFETINRY